jgi:mono/diheme cytochrome c family protein
MTIRIYCPACRTPFDVDDSLVGEKGLCPSCQSKFTIRKPDPPSTGQTHALGTALGAGATSALPPEAKPCGLAVTMAVLIMAAYGGAMAWVFKAFPAGSVPPKQLEVLGITHPMLLHLPIGMLIGALVLDFFGGRGKVHSTAVTWLLWLTLLCGAATALAGYFLGLKGYNSDFFKWHMWSGIAVPLATGLTLITKLIHDSKPAMASGIYRLPLLTTAAAIGMAGHFGGEMSHGFDVPGQVKSLFVSDSGSKEEPVEERTVYQAVIAPLLAEKCISCHGDKKQKGDLRLDSIEALVKAGETGNASIVPGKSADSESIKRILLAGDHDDHMPPEGKTQLTADEVEILKWWVDSGAKPDVKIKDAALPEALKTKVISLATGKSGGAKSVSAVSKNHPDANGALSFQHLPVVLGALVLSDVQSGNVLTQEPPAAAPAAPAPAAAAPPASEPAKPAPPPADDKVKALEKELGIVLLPVAQNDPALTFNCVNVADKFGDAELAKFAPIAERFVELNLSRSKVTDAAAATLAGMKNLKRLNLANTAITDAAVDQLSSLAGLEYLNLVGTKVTDAALPKLEKTAGLKKLYVWQTGVTKPAAEALHAKLPAIAINLGWDSEVKTAQAPPPPPATTPTPAPGGPLDPEKPVYAGLIEPIIAAKCVSCHGDKKQKGKLAMHTMELLMKGGDSGEKTIVAGKSGESLIVKRIDLPKDDDDHMPPSDKDQLTEKEVKILKWWIDGGLKNDVKIKDAGLPDDLK